jgi:hypothetical protein
MSLDGHPRAAAMAKKPRPAQAGDCPKGGDHNYVKTSEGGGYVTHTCKKCKDAITRKQEGRMTSGRALLFVLLLGLPVAMTVIAAWAQRAT